MIFAERCDGGAHATTRLAAEALRAVCAGATVLDVGTGDGALAAVALACGARRVAAIDRDPAAAGLALAGVDGCVADVLAAPPREAFDVVVANLPEPVALAALPALAACARRALIVTGGRLPRAAAFMRSLERLGLAVAPPAARDGWFCVTARASG